MDILAIRKLIEKDRIEEALEKTAGIVSAHNTNLVVSLSNRYSNWKRNKQRGLGDNLPERHSIIIAILEILSEEEKEENEPAEDETITITESASKPSTGEPVADPVKRVDGAIRCLF